MTEAKGKTAVGTSWSDGERLWEVMKNYQMTG